MKKLRWEPAEEPTQVYVLTVHDFRKGGDIVCMVQDAELFFGYAEWDEEALLLRLSMAPPVEEREGEDDETDEDEANGSDSSAEFPHVIPRDTSRLWDGEEFSWVDAVGAYVAGDRAFRVLQLVGSITV